ncbi:hypothetical protein ACWIGM_29465 [Bosea sp. NPDC055332]
MLYLAVQFSWFLLAAFAIGLAFGWLTLGRGRSEVATGPIAGFVLLWGALAGLVWFRLVNDQAAFWIETALLHLLAYAAGCLVGSVFGAGGGEALPALAPPAPRLALPQPAPSLPAPSAPTEVSAPHETVADVVPEVAEERAGAGKRPGNLLPGARGGKPDNLRLIAGIDLATAEKLNALGLWHFDQIAALGPDELRFVADHLGLPESGAAEGWRTEAEILAKGGETAHSRSVKAKRSRKKR